MPTVTLNDRKIKGLAPAAAPVEYFDRTFPAFGVRVWPSGAKAFVLFYRQNRKQRRMTLGQYPDLTLSKARQKARDALTAVSEGRDPGQEQIATKARTFDALARRYLDKHAKKKKRSWRSDDRIIRCELAPHWQHRPVASIKRADVRELVDGIAERPAPIFANRVLALIRTMFNFAIDQEWIEANPAQRLPAPGKEHKRDRVLSDDEIRQLWAFLHTEPTGEHARWTRLSRAVLLLRLITGQRGAELIQMRRADLQGAWWTIPADVAKNGLAHRVYLTPLALHVLERIAPDLSPDAEYLFQGIRGTRQRKHALDGMPLTNFQPRDLRRTAASHMAMLGVNRLVISKVLNHVETGITAVYDRHGYDAEKRRAWHAWDQHLTWLVCPVVLNVPTD